jgi:hypothetical protein
VNGRAELERQGIRERVRLRHVIVKDHDVPVCESILHGIRWRCRRVQVWSGDFVGQAGARRQGGEKEQARTFMVPPAWFTRDGGSTWSTSPIGPTSRRWATHHLPRRRTAQGKSPAAQGQRPLGGEWMGLAGRFGARHHGRSDPPVGR